MGTTTDDVDLGTILGVWAHPDDENYLSGGLMALAADHGRTVCCVTATKGEAGTDDPVAWPPDKLAALRAGELEECLRILGVADHRWLDYPDGGCAGVPHDEAVATLVAIIEEIRPEVVLTFGPDGMTGHDDHKAVSRWTTEAFELAASPGSSLHYATKVPGWAEEVEARLRELGAIYGDAVMPITEIEDCSIYLRCEADLLVRKMQAALAQESQIRPLLAALGEELTLKAISEEPFRLAARA